MSADTFELKGSPERDAEAARIRSIRDADRGAFENIEVFKGYNLNRGYTDYDRAIPQRISALMDHAKKLSPTPLVVDLGGGTTRAAYEMSQFDWTQGIDIVATGVTSHPAMDRYLGRDKVRITTAERMRGFEKESVDGILAVYSLMYADPDKAAKRLTEVLKPGGAILAGFSHEDSRDPEVAKEARRAYVRNGANPWPELEPGHGHETLREAFTALGFYTDIDDWREGVTLLAIKPGGPLGNVDSSSFFSRFPNTVPEKMDRPRKSSFHFSGEVVEQERFGNNLIRYELAPRFESAFDIALAHPASGAPEKQVMKKIGKDGSVQLVIYLRFPNADSASRFDYLANRGIGTFQRVIEDGLTQEDALEKARDIVEKESGFTLKMFPDSL